MKRDEARAVRMPRLSTTPSQDHSGNTLTTQTLPALDRRLEIRGSEEILRKAQEIAALREKNASAAISEAATPEDVSEALTLWTKVRRQDHLRVAEKRHRIQSTSKTARQTASPKKESEAAQAEPENPRPKTTGDTLGVVAKDYWRAWGSKATSTWSNYIGATQARMQRGDPRHRAATAPCTKSVSSPGGKKPLTPQQKGSLAKSFISVHEESVSSEESKFVSSVRFCEVKWEEALAVAAKLGFPNEFTTSVALSILGKLLSLTPAFDRLKDSLLYHLRLSVMGSVYSKRGGKGEQSHNGNTASFVDSAVESTLTNVEPTLTETSNEMSAAERFVPYFSLYRGVKKENRRLTKRVLDLQLRGSQRKDLIDQTLRRWQLSLAGMALRQWRKTIETRKRQTKLLTRFFASRSNKLVSVAFKEWAQSVHRNLRLALRDRLTEISLEREKYAGDNEELKHSVRKLEIETKEYENQYMNLIKELYGAEEKLKALSSGSTKATASQHSNMAKMARVTLNLAKGALDSIRADTNQVHTLQDPQLLLSDGTQEELEGLSPVETADQFLAVPSQEVLVRWLNYHLKSSGETRRVDNFGSCLQDCACWALVCKRVFPDFPAKDILEIPDFEARAARLLAELRERGLSPPVLPEHIAKGAPEMNVLLAVEIFRRSPGLNAQCRGVEAMIDTAWDHIIAFESRVERQEKICYKVHAGGTPDEVPNVEWTDEINRLHATLDACARSLEQAKTNAAKADGLSRRLQQRMGDLAVVITDKRVHGTPVDVFDTRTLRERKKFSKLYPERIADLLSKENDPAAQLRKCEEILESHVELLQQTYRYYGTLDGGLTISMKEFWKFAKDCNLASKSLPLAAIDVIFVRANWKSEKGSDIHNPERELIPGEFAEALLRIAAAKFAGMSSLAERLSTLIGSYVVKFAGRADTSKWRQEFSRVEVDNVFKQHYEDLWKIFYCYSAGPSRSKVAKRHSGTMVLEEFMALCKDARLLEGSFSSVKVYSIFANVQQDEGLVEAEEAVADSEMIFPEFLEGLAVVAVFKIPDPYIPLEQRLATFLKTMLLPPMEPKLTHVKITKDFQFSSISSTGKGTGGGSKGRKTPRSARKSDDNAQAK